MEWLWADHAVAPTAARITTATKLSGGVRDWRLSANVSTPATVVARTIASGTISSWVDANATIRCRYPTATALKVVVDNPVNEREVAAIPASAAPVRFGIVTVDPGIGVQVDPSGDV
jgi:hypothetical protein